MIELKCWHSEPTEPCIACRDTGEALAEFAKAGWAGVSAALVIDFDRAAKRIAKLEQELKSVEVVRDAYIQGGLTVIKDRDRLEQENKRLREVCRDALESCDGMMIPLKVIAKLQKALAAERKE